MGDNLYGGFLRKYFLIESWSMNWWYERRVGKRILGKGIINIRIFKLGRVWFG